MPFQPDDQRHADNQHDDQQHIAASPRGKVRRIAQHALHPVVHVSALVALHSMALLVLEKTPLLALLSLH